jgi:hypothetical protein
VVTLINLALWEDAASPADKLRLGLPVNDWNDGGQGRNRTADASLFRAALYRLSYLANTCWVTYVQLRWGRMKTLCVRNVIDYNNDVEFSQTGNGTIFK